MCCGRARRDLRGAVPLLLLGSERALVLDTGAVADPTFLAVTVDGLIDHWLAQHPRDAIRAGRRAHPWPWRPRRRRRPVRRPPGDTLVGREAEVVRDFFGLSRLARGHAPLDLGGRALEVAAIPGHHRASIAVYDPWSGFLLTGDTVYPGRLYVEDMPAFVASLDRLVGLAESRDVRQVMGCHIEMTATPGRDYPLGSTYQPDEPVLQMSVDRLRAVRDAAHLVADQPGPHWYDDFAIFNGPCRAEMLRQAGRTLTARARLLFHS